MDTIWGTGLLEWCASRADDPAWVAGWRAVAFLGSSTFFVVLLPWVLATLRPRLGLPFTAAVLGSGLVTEILKHAVARPRLDPADFGAPVLEAADSFGADAFPSGHALMAVVVWGWIAARRPFPRAGWVAGLVVAAIAASRLALLRHDLLDVVAGLAIGGLLLTLLVGWERLWAADLWELPWVEQAGIWLLVGLGVQAAAGLDSTAILAGVLSGAGVGTAWLRGTQKGGAVGWGRRFVRGLVALAGVLAVRQVAPDLHGWMLFGIYAAAGLWVTAVAPRWLGGPIRR